jgi:hypothetical protein
MMTEVVAVKTGVVNEVPAVPAVLTFELYQTTFPLAQLAVSVVVKPEQIAVPLETVGGVGFGFTVTSTCVLEVLIQFGEPPL